MWEELKMYKQLNKECINSTYKKFGNRLVTLVDGYSLDQTASVMKLFRQVNQLEQAIFFERKGYDLRVNTSIKPVDFYRRHKFTMVNIVPLGDIMNNHRRHFIL